MTRGRPRQFDADAALNRAMQLFWRKGYEGTSLTDLTRAMNINRPSLYAAFGNKKNLFNSAIDRYSAGPACYFTAALKAPTAGKVAEGLLRGTVDVATCPKNPRGCMIVQAALASSSEANPIRKALISRRQTGEAAIRRRFQKARAQGDLPKTSNPTDLARYLNTLIHGLAVQAASGATRPQLLRVVRAALKKFP